MGIFKSKKELAVEAFNDASKLIEEDVADCKLKVDKVNQKISDLVAKKAAIVANLDLSIEYQKEFKKVVLKVDL